MRGIDGASRELMQFKAELRLPAKRKGGLRRPSLLT